MTVHPPSSTAEDRIDLAVTAAADGLPLIEFLASQLPGLSRAALRRLLAEGDLRVDGVAAAPKRPLRRGERITGYCPLLNPAGIEPERLPLDIYYEDDDLLVVCKPAGMVVHPSPGHWHGTLANAVLGHWRASGQPAARFGPGHRLDRDTSGLVAIGKHSAASRALGQQIERGSLRRAYLALAEGAVAPAAGVIDLPLARIPANRFRSGVTPGGQPARTRYRTIESLPHRTLLEVELETGRTHQIRAHLAALGWPLAGDSLYGGGTGPAELARQFLHAHRLRLRQPTTGAALAFEAPLPDDLSAALSAARRQDTSRVGEPSRF